MSEVDGFYILRKDQAALLATLRSIPAIVEDLAVTETKQGHIRRHGLDGSKRPRPESSVPYHEAAFIASEALRGELVAWVRLVCEQRAIEPSAGQNSILGASGWLKTNIIALAMTEGAEEAPENIAERVSDCRKIVDLPPEDKVVIDRDRLERANKFVGTLMQIVKVSAKIGPMGKGINERRMKTLTRTKDHKGKPVEPRLKPCAEDEGTKFYQLGDTLTAHHGHAKRKGA